MSRSFHLVVLLVYAVTVLIWFWAFPLVKNFSSIDLTTEGLYFLAALVSYRVASRLRIRALEIGWPVFTYGILIDLLDEFTRDSAFPNDPIEDLLNGMGMLLIAFGFLAAYRQRTQERDALHRSTAALDAERTRLGTILGAIGDGVAALDSGGKVQFLNRAASRICAMPSEKAVGLWIGQVLPLASSTGDTPAPDLVALVRSGALSTEAGGDFHFPMEGGATPRTIEVYGALLEASDGFSDEVILAFRDVTRRRRLEQEMLADGREESVRLLAGGVAHDFNNILAAIQSWVALGRLREGRSDGPDALEKIEAACRRGKRLGTQLMALTRGGEPVKAPVRLGDMIRDETEFALRGTGVVVLFDLDPDLWAAEIDAGQVSQVLHNILLNAHQAMPDGGRIWIHAANQVVTGTSELPLDSGRFVAITIRDDGPGIAPEHLERIFQPYFTTRESGSGLGLATSQAIVRRHGGALQVDCPPTGGSEFLIMLPASTRPARPVLLAQAPPTGAWRLLLVDDNIDVREPVALALREKGYEVDVAESGRVAVEHYRQVLAVGGRIDLVIMDLTMPGDIGGREAMKRIHALDAHARGVIASGYHQDPVMARHREHGFLGVITKPFEINDLIELVERAVREEPA